YGANLDLHSFPTRRSSDLVRMLRTNQNENIDEDVEYKTLNEQSHIIRDKYFEYVESIIYPIASNSVSDQYKQYLEAPDLEEFRIDRKSTRLNSSHVKISYA